MLNVGSQALQGSQGSQPLSDGQEAPYSLSTDLVQAQTLAFGLWSVSITEGSQSALVIGYVVPGGPYSPLEVT